MARTPPRELHLVTLKGDCDPNELKLEQARVLSIGRTGNIRIHDPLVSIHHAKLYYDLEARSFVIEDLNSANGTFVNGECIRGDSRLIRRGTELRIGDTVLELQTGGTRVPWIRLRPLVLLAMLLAMLGVLGQFLYRYLTSVPVVVATLPAPDAVLMGGRGQVQDVPVDYEFLWDNGIGWPLEIRQVTRIRELRSDLVWIADAGREHGIVVTFDDDERWKLVGDLPGYGKIIENADTVYPIYTDSTGGRWSYDLRRGRYRRTDNSSLVVWYRKIPPKSEDGTAFHAPPPPGPLQVGRFAFKGDRAQISLFLTERNVQVPVHYVICEGAFAGVRPQVLTYEGTIQELAPACLRSLRIEGEEDPVMPVAVALDDDGREALIDDVTTFYTGDPDGLFLGDEFRSVIKAVGADPGTYRGAVRLVVQSDFAISPPFDPFPSETDPLPVGRHGLLPDQHDPLAPNPAPEVTVVPLPYAGRQGDVVKVIPTTGCEKLQVVMHEQYQRVYMLMSAPFAEVTSVGCDEDRLLLTVPFQPGVAAHVDPKGTDVAVRVEMDGKRVRTAEFGWRP